MGEKFDGIRAFWNPKIKKMFSRQGKLVRLPYFVSSYLPVRFLDGEFWFGRRNYLLAMQLLFCASISDVQWGKIRYMVFDCPSPQLLGAQFEKRYWQLLLIKAHQFLIICSRLSCSGKLNMSQYLNKLIHNRGEGIMLREPNSVYERGKSHSLFKVKNIIDADAVVVKIYNNVLVCKLNDQEIIVAKNNNFFVNIGSVVTIGVSSFKQRQSLSHSHKILRVRYDL